jgi:hypothetical protein
MDRLHSVLRVIRGEPQRRRDHLAVFREFLAHLDRAGRRPPPPPRGVKQAVNGPRTDRRHQP